MNDATSTCTELIEFQSPEWQELLKVRGKSLFPLKNADHDFSIEGDQNPSTLHFLLFIELQNTDPVMAKKAAAAAAACASFVTEPHPTRSDYQNVYRLRQMGVHPSYQGKGLGTQILQKAINELKRRNGEWVWCKARKIAYQFYLAQGFEFISEEYEIPEIGPHRTMQLNFSNPKIIVRS